MEVLFEKKNKKIFNIRQQKPCWIQIRNARFLCESWRIRCRPNRHPKSFWLARIRPHRRCRNRWQEQHDRCDFCKIQNSQVNQIQKSNLRIAVLALLLVIVDAAVVTKKRVGNSVCRHHRSLLKHPLNLIFRIDTGSKVKEFLWNHSAIVEVF